MERKQEILTKIAYYSFYIAVMIEVLMVIIDKSALTNPIEGRLFQITFLLFFIKVCLTRYSLKEYGVIAIFLALGGVSYFVTGRNEIIRVVMFIAACKDIDMKKCLKLVFYITLSGCVLLILLSLTGIMGTVSLTMDYGRGSEETRYVLGMGHPNALHCMIWALILLGIYVYADQMKWYGYAGLFIINLFFFRLTDSKTSFLITVITILGAALLQYIPKLRSSKLIEVIGITAFLSSILISIMGAANAILVSEYYWSRDFSAKAKFYVFIDKFLTGRLQTLACTVNMEGTIGTWRLFSNPQSNYFFDLGWVRLFYWYGIIPAIVFIIMILLLIHYCYKHKDYMGFLMILSISVYTIIEAHVISDYIARNYVFFLLGAYWNHILIWKRERTKINVKSADCE